MSEFYTNIEVRGNSVLYMGWKNGIPIKEKIAYTPHLFVASNEDTEYHAFQTNQPLKKVDFETIADMKTYVAAYGNISNFTLYGCSNVKRQFTRAMFPMEIVWDYLQTKIFFFDIETRVEGLDTTEDAIFQVRLEDEENFSVASYRQCMRLLDTDTPFYIIENEQEVFIKNAGVYVAGFPKPELAQQEITMVSLIDHHTAKLKVFTTLAPSSDNEIYKYDVDVMVFESEKSMLKEVVKYFATTRIDVLCGWNSESFDMPYMVNRCTKIIGKELTNFLSPWKVIKDRIVIPDNPNFDRFTTYELLGITHLDYLDIYKKFNPGSKESFKLDYIAEYELGKKKVENPTDNFRDFYLKYKDTFIHYNVIDVFLLHELEHKLLMVKLAQSLAYIAKCNIGDVVSAMRLWESIIYNYFMDKNVIETWNKPRNDKKEIVGAYVHTPIPGKYGWTISVDATALYPSIIMQNNLSPDTIIEMLDFGELELINGMLRGEHTGKFPDGSIISANGLITSKDHEGFLPYLIRQMFDLRKKTKNLMLDKKKEQQAVKLRLKELGVDIE